MEQAGTATAATTIIASAIWPIIGLFVGAGLQYWASRASDARRALRELRTTAYVDYLRCVSESAHSKSSDKPQLALIRQRAADAKTRICIYGELAVVEALSIFERGGATTVTDTGRKNFLKLCEQMRIGSANNASNVSRENLDVILFGPPDRTPTE